MEIEFYKYQGTGNDFVIIDNRPDVKPGKHIFDKKNLEMITCICDRRFGVGADGLILIEDHPDYDFEMIYYNADGSQSFCGNGSRCAVSFADKLGLIGGRETHFLSTDGPHRALLMDKNHVKLKMGDVNEIENEKGYCFLNTGSPHYIDFVEDVDAVDVLEEGKKIRYNNRFKEKGTNVNFVQMDDDLIKMRTYERGVEAETLSCGTGVTAAALCARLKDGQFKEHIRVSTPGGILGVSFKKVGEKFEDIWLEGPAEMVFKGIIDL